MKYLELYRYINKLSFNQNLTDTELLHDIFLKKDYYHLLLPVLDTIKNNKFDSLTTIRYKLFVNSGLKDKIEDFVYDREITPGVILDFGTKKTRDTITCGNKQEYTYQNGKYILDLSEISYDTIFDLASTSKLFTMISILKLYDMGLIDLFNPINYYVKEFVNLDDVTIYDLLKFRVKISTDKRVDSASSIEEAEKFLFTAKKDENQIFINAYTDMGAMVLKYVVEKVAKIPFSNFVEDTILKPLNMEDTYLNVPPEKLNRVANENYSTIIKNDGTSFTRMDNFPGTVHDPKSVIMGHASGNAPGHAGYFSTTKDMIKLGNSFLDSTILKRDTVLSIAENAVGVMNSKGDYTRFYGSLVYLKQPGPKFLRVYPPLSGKAFMSPGFAGTTLCVDPINNITLFIGSNRLHNRVYQISSAEMTRVKENEWHKKTIKLEDGTEKILCDTYTRDKEEMVKLALDLSLQYQLLERIYGKEKEMHLVREI